MNEYAESVSDCLIPRKILQHHFLFREPERLNEWISDYQVYLAGGPYRKESSVLRCISGPLFWKTLNSSTL